jgi:hypothetical protein
VVGRQLGEGALDAERNFFEALEGSLLEDHASSLSSAGLFAAEDVDERVDRARSLDLPQDLGDGLQLEDALVFAVAAPGRRSRLAQHIEQDVGGGARDFIGDPTGRALRLEQLANGALELGTIRKSHGSGGIVFYLEMHPLIRVAFVPFVLIALGSRAGVGGARVGGEQGPTQATSLARSKGADGMSAPCPAGTLPDQDVCVPIPGVDDLGSDELIALGGAHHDKRGRYEIYDQIPRRPDRPAEYESYRYPIPIPDTVRLTMSGYDLDRPEGEQRQGRKFSHVGHGGIDLPAPRGTEVHLIALEHQEGDAEVLFVGKLFGTTVITKHTLREGGRLRDYVLLHGHLDGVAPGLARGQGSLPEKALLGYVGDTGSEGIVHLHLEARRVRDGVDLASTVPERLIANEISVVCDPRNVLPLK